MQFKQLTSTDNPIIKKVCNLKKTDNTFLISSNNIIKQAIANDYHIIDLFIDEKNIDKVDESIKRSAQYIYLVNERIINKINSTTKYNYVFALAQKKHKQIQIENNDINLVLLDNIQNPENMGLIIRTVLGLGFDKILTINCVDLYHEKVISASAGYCLNDKIINLSSIDEIKTLKSKSYKIVITSLDKSSIDIHQTQLTNRDKKIVCFGNEGHGIREQLIDLADVKIKLKMHNNLNSFNVAVSAAIIGYILMNK